MPDLCLATIFFAPERPCLSAACAIILILLSPTARQDSMPDWGGLRHTLAPAHSLSLTPNPKSKSQPGLKSESISKMPGKRQVKRKKNAVRFEGRRKQTIK